MLTTFENDRESDRSRLTDFAVGAVSSGQTVAGVSAGASDARAVVLTRSAHARIKHCNSVAAVMYENTRILVEHAGNEKSKQLQYFTH